MKNIKKIKADLKKNVHDKEMTLTEYVKQYPQYFKKHQTYFIYCLRSDGYFYTDTDEGYIKVINDK